MYSLAGFSGGTFDKWTPLAELCRGDLGSGVGSWLVYLPTAMLAPSSTPPPLSTDSYWLIMRPCTHEWMGQAPKDTHSAITHPLRAWLCWDGQCWRAAVVRSTELCSWFLWCLWWIIVENLQNYFYSTFSRRGQKDTCFMQIWAFVLISCRICRSVC